MRFRGWRRSPSSPSLCKICFSWPIREVISVKTLAPLGGKSGSLRALASTRNRTGGWRFPVNVQRMNSCKAAL